jgi:penicillin V acylase-like amidase (Ntn superfamily)
VKLKIRVLIGLALAAVLWPGNLCPCTTFCLKAKDGTILYGRNFDFPCGFGQVQVNQRNVRKTSLANPSEKPLTWVSRYGSLTFNQNGREFPYGGMNERGLVIEQMWLDAATYPQPDERFGLEELQWIQYQLDTAATVADVIDSDHIVRISNTSVAPLHFLVADAQGHVAAVEYLDGRMVVHKGQDLPYPVLANDTYQASLDYLAGLKARRSKPSPERRGLSLNRFAAAASMLERYDGNASQAVDYAFAILREVAQNGTQWSIVYDLKNKTIAYKTRANGDLRRVELGRFDYSCSPTRLCADIEADVKSPSEFEAYTDEGNAKLIDRVWDSVEFLKSIPAEIRAAFAGYPARVACARD